jgi:hypothetical protein
MRETQVGKKKNKKKTKKKKGKVVGSLCMALKGTQSIQEVEQRFIIFHVNGVSNCSFQHAYCSSPR